MLKNSEDTARSATLPVSWRSLAGRDSPPGIKPFRQTLLPPPVGHSLATTPPTRRNPESNTAPRVPRDAAQFNEIGCIWDICTASTSSCPPCHRRSHNSRAMPSQLDLPHVHDATHQRIVAYDYAMGGPLANCMPRLMIHHVSVINNQSTDGNLRPSSIAQIDHKTMIRRQFRVSWRIRVVAAGGDGWHGMHPASRPTRVLYGRMAI